MQSYQKIRISEADFFTGFFAGLAKSNVKAIFMQSTDFDKAVVDAFDTVFVPRAEAAGYDVRFLLRCSQFHGDSPGVRQGVAAAVQRGVLNYRSPSYTTAYLRIPAEKADLWLSGVPGDPNIYIDTADRFLDIFSGVN